MFARPVVGQVEIGSGGATNTKWWPCGGGGAVICFGFGMKMADSSVRGACIDYCIG